MDLKSLWLKIKSDYRHFICIGLTIIFLLLSIFYFKYALGRIIESCTDIGTSCVYYVSELFDLGLHGEITVNNFTKMPFEMPWNLPNTWEEFKVLWNDYWKLFFTGFNLVNYFISLGDLLYYLSRILIILLPIIFILIIIKIVKKNNINNNYNLDSKSLSWWKSKFELKFYLPVKNWIIRFIRFIKENSYYWKLWLLIWLYNFNGIAILFEFIAYYLYFVASFDLVSLYIQFIKLLQDLSFLLDILFIVWWCFDLCYLLLLIL